MKKILYSILLYASCLLLFACETPQNVTITNDSDLALVDKWLSIERTAFPETVTEYVALQTEDGAGIPTYFEDQDEDGEWEQLYFSMNIPSNSTNTLSWQDSSNPSNVEPKTQVHLGYRATQEEPFQAIQKSVRPETHVPQAQPYIYQFEGPGWENEKIAFRHYFDARNGKDIFGKATPGLHLDQVGLSGTYHELADWGMDILKVGTSLGAGAIGMLKEGQLYRLGETATATFELVESTPIRSTFHMTFEGWTVGDQLYDVRETIRIEAGQRWYESELKLLNSNSSDTLVTGIVNFFDLTAQQLTVEDTQILYTYGEQSDNKDRLGMAVLVPYDHFGGYGQAANFESEVTDTELIFLQPKEGKYRYRFYVGWELENEQFKTEEGFKDAIQQALKHEQTVVRIDVQ